MLSACASICRWASESKALRFDRWQDGQWIEFASGTSIGNCRLVRSKPITTAKIRLRITQAAACPALSELSLFAEPNMQSR